MRIALAEISQETNTFSPVLTTLPDFEQNGLYSKDEILAKMPGVGPLGGFLAVFKELEGVKLLPILRAQATPGGRLTTDTFAALEARLLAGVQEALPLDGLFLSLHGAASAEGIDDADGRLLDGVRRIVGPGVRVVVALDHHANLTSLMVESADVVTGFQTQPHDPVETGMRAAKILLDLVRGGSKPSCSWFKIPMVTPQDQFLTSSVPMKAWFDMAREVEQGSGVISASTFPMQPWLDVEEAGWAAAVYTDGDPNLARRLAARLADAAWALRERFWVSDRITMEQAIRMADQAQEGLIILADTGDSVYGGAPGDSTWLLGMMLEQGISSTAYLPLVDEEAVDGAFRAGEGSLVTLNLGGKMDHLFGRPVRLTCRVAKTTEGLSIDLREAGQVGMGRTALLEVGSIKIAVADSRLQAINFPEMYTHLGLEIPQAKMVVLKTASNFQHFAQWRKGLIRVDTPGMTQSDLHAFRWMRAPRPLYPLDKLDSWRAGAEAA